VRAVQQKLNKAIYQYCVNDHHNCPDMEHRFTPDKGGVFCTSKVQIW